MNLHDYLLKSGLRQSELARKLGVTPVLVHQWAHGVRRIPAERCPDIERETDGEVRCEDLRPDVSWSYLRSASCGSEAP